MRAVRGGHAGVDRAVLRRRQRAAGVGGQVAAAAPPVEREVEARRVPLELDVRDGAEGQRPGLRRCGQQAAVREGLREAAVVEQGRGLGAASLHAHELLRAAPILGPPPQPPEAAAADEPVDGRLARVHHRVQRRNVREALGPGVGGADGAILGGGGGAEVVADGAEAPHRPVPTARRHRCCA